MAAVVRELAVATGRVCESNGWNSGATTGDAPLYVVRRGVTAGLMGLRGGGRPAVSQDRFTQDSCGCSRPLRTDQALVRRDAGSEAKRQHRDATEYFLCFPKGPCLGGERTL